MDSLRTYSRYTIEQLELMVNNPTALTEQRLLNIFEELQHRDPERSSALVAKVASLARKRAIQLPGFVRSRSARSSTRAEPDLMKDYRGAAPKSPAKEAGTRKEEIMISAEDERLRRLFDELRVRLLDLTKRNRMLNYPVRGSSRRQIQFHDEIIEDVYQKLVGEDVSLRISPLPEPTGVPAEEKTEEFIAALEHAKLTDLEYLIALQAIETAGGSDEETEKRAEAALRQRLRDRLGLPPRLARSEINKAEHARSLGIDPNPELKPRSSKPAHTDSLLQTLLYPDELERQLEKIAADARLAEQEAGLSTLYVGLGFLEWYESDTSDKAYFAPLLLLPVKIETSKVRGKTVFYISATEEGAEANISLRKFLESDRYGRTLPEFGTEEGDDTPSIEQYFEQVRQSIQGLSRWQVHRWLVLGHFAFNRIAIYEDTDPGKWAMHPASSPLVKSLLSGAEAEGSATVPGLWPEDYNIDEPSIEGVAPILVQDADASQHSALVDLMQGKNLVIHGPPGTGKSQTITNVIANLLAAGKTVLFLAEKQAALEVVKRRLDSSGLGDFCLELHSDKSAPKSVIQSLETRFQASSSGPSQRTIPDPTWRRARDTLNEYASAMNQETRAGLTAFEAIWAALKARQAGSWTLGREGIELPEQLVADPDLLLDVRGRVQIFAELCGPFLSQHGPVTESPWLALRRSDLTRSEQQRLVRAIRDLQNIESAWAEAKAALKAEGIDDASHLRILTQTLPSLPAAVEEGLVGQLKGRDLQAARSALRNSAMILALEGEVAAIPGDEALPDPPILQSAARLAAAGFDSALLQLPAAEMVGRLERRSALGARLLHALEETLPLRTALDIGDDASLEQVSAAAIGLEVIISISQEIWSWISLGASDDPDFEPLSRRWTALIHQKEVIDRFFGRETDSISLEELDRAIAVLRRPTLSRLVSKFGSEERETATLLKALELAGSSEENASDLERLALYRRKVREFDGDVAGRRIFGEAWRGMDTPFDLVAAANQCREQVASQMGRFDVSGSLATRMFALSSAEVIELAKCHHVGRRWLEVSAGVDAATMHMSIETAAKEWQEAAVDRALLNSIDPSGALGSQQLSGANLAKIFDLRLRLDEARTNFANLHLPAPLDQPIVQSSRSAAIRDAIDWIEACPTNLERVRARLLSTGLNDYRGRLDALVSQATSIEGERTAAISELSTFLQEALLSGPSNWIDGLLHAEPQLQEYLNLRREADPLVSVGLGNFVTWAWSAIRNTSDILDTFNALAAEHAAVRAVEGSPTLARASGNTLDAQRKTFVERDKLRLDKDRANLRQALLKAVPPMGVRTGPAKALTEMGLLQREFARQRGHTKVRALMRRAGTAIRMLKPCTMMSPLSLAKYLDPSPGQYDVLVIDEASQMKPEDALGAMLRVSQIVVVGDQKQLPPTSFFDRVSVSATDEDEDLDDVDDESILERCQKVFGNVRQLKWHYRSRCESLIRFSNENFYDNRLITFPAPQPGAFSIDLVRVDGYYQARRNVPEAEQIAEEAVRFMRAHADSPEDTVPTLGVVAMNTEQRDLIQETIRQYQGDDEAVARYREKVANRGEEVFVKNLENVQGDERDYIFISMTYGRKPGSAVVEQRFGPINSRQGHRRLNVLFSRARQRVAIFSSLGSSDIKPTEASHDGVVKLQRYLEYVEQKGRMSYQSVGREAESDFEVSVADRLSEKGYRTVPQVGVSGFRIDLGVIDPDRPGRFMAGVECDGASYHSSSSARDRDRIRQEVLEGLGWSILRVWSTDWFANPELEVEKLTRKLGELRTNNNRVLRSDYVIGINDREPDVPPRPSETPSLETKGSAEARDGSDDEGGTEIAALLDNDDPITEQEAYRVLTFLRQNVVSAGSDVEPHRSILREGMIETLISQRVTDPEDWFTKVPQFQRSATDPVEKRRHLETICSIVARIRSDTSKRPLVTPTTPDSQPGGVVPALTAQPSSTYALVDMSQFAALDPRRLYDLGYRPTLISIIDAIIAAEGPIFADVLAVRIARAHGKDRTGGVIQSLVSSATRRDYPRSREGNRTIVWPLGSNVDRLVPFRHSPQDTRSHDDIPEVELASLAVSFLSLKMNDEDVLQQFAEQFGLQRLRASSRERFASAIRLANKARSTEASAEKA